MGDAFDVPEGDSFLHPRRLGNSEFFLVEDNNHLRFHLYDSGKDIYPFFHLDVLCYFDHSIVLFDIYVSLVC